MIILSTHQVIDVFGSGFPLSHQFLFGSFFAWLLFGGSCDQFLQPTYFIEQLLLELTLELLVRNLQLLLELFPQ